MEEEGEMFGDQNQNELRLHLENLQQEFQVSYTMRRQVEYNDPKEELIHVIQELNQREQACMAVAGIALYLIEKNETLTDDYNNLQESSKELQQQLKDKFEVLDQMQEKLVQKNRKKTLYKTELDDRESRLKEYQDCIEELKQEHENLYSQFVQIQNEKDQKKKNQPRASILLREQIQLTDQKKNLEFQVLSFQKEIQQLEKSLKESRKLENQWQQQAQKSQEELMEVKEKLQDYVKKIEQLEIENQSLQSQLDEEDREKQKLLQEKNNVQQQLEMEQRRRSTSGPMLSQASFGSRRESTGEVEVVETNKNSNLLAEMGGQDMHRGSFIKQFELTAIEELVEENNIPSTKATPSNKIQFTPKHSTKKFELKPLLTTQLIEVIHIMDGQLHNIMPERRRRGKTRQFIKPRKPPLEEYFHLLAQAVKMNSPYMDSICATNTDQMYFQCCQEQISYQNWSQWIEKYLNKKYMDQYYNPEAQKQRRQSKLFNKKSAPLIQQE